MRNLSTGSNVYLHPSPNPSANASVRAIYEHIHKCRHELSLFKHSVWPKVCFHILQLSGQAPVLFPLSWFPKRKEYLWHVRFMRRWVLKPIADACLQSCKSSSSPAKVFRSPCAAQAGAGGIISCAARSARGCGTRGEYLQQELLTLALQGGLVIYRGTWYSTAGLRRLPGGLVDYTGTQEDGGRQGNRGLL